MSWQTMTNYSGVQNRPAYTNRVRLPSSVAWRAPRELEPHYAHYLVYVKYQTAMQGLENEKRHGGYNLRYRRKYES